jgi:hypothetical protein
MHLSQYGAAAGSSNSLPCLMEYMTTGFTKWLQNGKSLYGNSV